MRPRKAIRAIRGGGLWSVSRSGSRLLELDGPAGRPESPLSLAPFPLRSLNFIPKMEPFVGGVTSLFPKSSSLLAAARDVNGDGLP